MGVLARPPASEPEISDETAFKKLQRQQGDLSLSCIAVLNTLSNAQHSLQSLPLDVGAGGPWWTWRAWRAVLTWDARAHPVPSRRSAGGSLLLLLLARLAYPVPVLGAVEFPADPALAGGGLAADVAVHRPAFKSGFLQLCRQFLGCGHRQLAGVVLADVGRGFAVDHTAGFE